jgi:predicted nucleic acid-binding protein
VRLVVDSSILIGGLDAKDRWWVACAPIVDRLARGDLSGYLPAHVLAETVCALRRRGGEELARVALAELTDSPTLTWLDVTFDVAEDACDIGIRTGLRGADAMIVQVADRLRLPLLTLDREIRDKAATVVQVIDPAEIIP